jgi:AIPR protein
LEITLAELQHSQIKSQLLQAVVPLIDRSDLLSWSGPDLESHLLSRAVAATAIRILAETDEATATKAVVDGSNDNGIDALYYDPKDRTLFLVQSKWSNSHGSSIESGDVLKFLHGVQDLVSLKIDRFNQKKQDRWSLVENALTKLTSVIVAVAYPGSSKINETIQETINDFIRSQNDTSELFFFSTISQRELFHYFVRQAAPPQIDLEVRLKHFGVVESPLRAVYGQVSASDVASWYRSHGNQLFARNIRNFLGSSEVNVSIGDTLKSDPEHFWYYNNGITIIAEELKKQAIGGSDRSIGQFDCKNVTIVNGAQTVGTIGRNEVSSESLAFLQARIIEVRDQDSSLGKGITRASNTQNKIDARNFVALDLEQERIRTELLIDKVTYEFREGELLESPIDGFDFIEAITTLACASGDIAYVATAKGYIGGLYSDITSTPYKALFNAATSSKRLWSYVKLARRLDRALKSHSDTNSPVERGIIVHGNRFLMHCAFRRIGKTCDLGDSDGISDTTIDDAAKNVFAGIKSVIQDVYADAYPAPLYKNVKKCADIRARFEAS